MRQIPKAAEKEALQFREQALAIISENYERIINSGFLRNKSLYKPNGQRITGFGREISKEIQERLLKGASPVLTAYEVDKSNNELSDVYSIAVKENADKFYIKLPFFEGEHVNGCITYSNAGEVYIHTLDKDNRILSCDRAEIYIDNLEARNEHELYKLSDKISRFEFASLFMDMSDISLEESIYYLKTLDINQYESQGSYADDKTYYTLKLLTLTDHDELIKALDNVMGGDGEISYIILDTDDDGRTGIIAEQDGNIFYSNHSDNEFAEYKRGEQFSILGAEETADTHILRSVYMAIYGHNQMITHFAEIEEPEIESEPEVKKPRTMKPGR